MTDASRGLRLQKALAEAGIASRRECEVMIAHGRVSVNGQKVTALPAWVDLAKDRVEVDGQLIVSPRRSTRPGVPARIYLLLHKPRRIISTTHDPEGRTNVLDMINLPPELVRRVFPVGRLDADSTGLILLTNDGELANRLSHPRYGVAKQYMVTVRGALSTQDVQRLKDGIFLASRRAGGLRGKPSPTSARRASMEDVKVMQAQRDRAQGDRTRLLITLREGQNREIRPMLARLDFQVRKLQCVAIGPITLKGLVSGKWRMLNPAEVRALRGAAVGGASLDPAGKDKPARKSPPCS